MNSHGIAPVPDAGPLFPLRSCIASQALIEAEQFQYWAKRLGETPLHMHRKVWEWCYIAQALHERGLLRLGSRGLGFAVGQEPLSALFASYGCRVVATDLQTEAVNTRDEDWISSGQHAATLADLNRRNICPDAEFRQRVSFRFVDMNSIPDDLRGFDFLWSSCSLEHLGSLPRGAQFIHNAMKCLKPGGVAVHTTEFNLSSNDATLEDGPTVLFRRRDMQEIGSALRSAGCTIDLDFTEGQGPYELDVDRAPYTHEHHLRLELLGYIWTSYGLVIQNAR